MTVECCSLPRGFQRARYQAAVHANDEARENDVSFGDFLWGLLVFYFIFFYCMTLFWILRDLFSDHGMSGLGKTGWLIALLVVPFLAMFVYLISRGTAMTERSMAHARTANEDQAGLRPPGRRQG
jgi:hypothetical protein